jgi:hypothetical protein
MATGTNDVNTYKKHGKISLLIANRISNITFTNNPSNSPIIVNVGDLAFSGWYWRLAKTKTTLNGNQSKHSAIRAHEKPYMN